jgi:hypothetical protein
MSSIWKCPRCKRPFRQANQRHSCGVGSREALLRNKPAALVALYAVLEKTLSSYPGVEIVTKDRYALFRTTRIFADLVFMRDALRLAIHLKREISHSLFFKVVRGDSGRVAHVAKLHDAAELRAIEAYVKEAYDVARDESD